MSDRPDIWDGAYRKQNQLWAGYAAIPDLPSGPVVLDLGCGNGRVFSRLLSKGHRALALDFSKTAVRAACSCCGEMGTGRGIIADARHLPLKDASVGAVVAWHVIGHMDEPGRIRIIRELLRVVQPGGMVFFKEFSRDDFRYRPDRCPGEDGTMTLGSGISTHYFTAGETEALFSSFTCTALTLSRWTMRVRGKDYPRSEIEGVFTRKGIG